MAMLASSLAPLGFTVKLFLVFIQVLQKLPGMSKNDLIISPYLQCFFKGP